MQVPAHEQLLELCTTERPGMPQASSGHPPCPKAGREGDCETRRKVDNEDEGNCRSDGTPYVWACLAQAIPHPARILIALCVAAITPTSATELILEFNAGACAGTNSTAPRAVHQCTPWHGPTAAETNSVAVGRHRGRCTVSFDKCGVWVNISCLYVCICVCMFCMYACMYE